MDTAQQTLMEQIKQERRSAKTVLSDSLAEGIAGGVVVVLSLVGLFNLAPELMLPVSAIVMGVAFLLESKSISVRILRLLGNLPKDELSGEQPHVGVTAEFIAGTTGVLLGFLALLGWRPLVMVPVVVIAYGSALIFGSGLTARLNDLEDESSGAPVCVTRLFCEAVSAATGAEFLFGMGAGILGIVALTGMSPVTATLGALLIVGLSSFLNGTAIIARIKGTLRK